MNQLISRTDSNLASVLGLLYVQRYRSLTIAQFARLSGLSRHHVVDLLHSFALRGVVGHFGHITIRPRAGSSA